MPELKTPGEILARQRIEAETTAAFRQAEIRLSHVGHLLSLISDEVRNIPVIVGDAELAALRRLVRDAANVSHDLKLVAQDNS